MDFTWNHLFICCLQTIIQNFITEQNLFNKEDQLLLAVSGGVDSMVMAHLLLKMDYNIALIHCNFKLRGAASDADQELVEEWGSSYNVPVYVQAFDTKAYAKSHQLSTQMAARDLRYAYFREILEAQNYDYLLTAHHLDDRLETFWLNFSRGTGWKGLMSLQAINGKIRRPLLAVNRAQIAAYQQTAEVPFREDESNASDEYRRNAFRHQVLPALYQWDTDIADRMPANFERMEQMHAIYATAVRTFLSELSEQTSNGWTYNKTALLAHEASETMIWELLNPFGFNAEDCRQVSSAKPGTILQTKNWQLLIQEKQLVLEQAVAEKEKISLLWEEKTDQLLLAEGESLHKRLIDKPDDFSGPANVAYFSTEKLIYPLLVRHWLPGDSFCPLGMNGKRQKLQDFFVNNKIDRFSRQRQWLLVNGDEEIIWIVGKRVDERFKVKEADSIVLKIRTL